MPSRRIRFTWSRKDRILTALTLAFVTAFTVVACTATSDREPEHAEEIALEHIHGLVADPAGDGVLIASHAGIYRLDKLDPDANLTGPLAGLDFDAMGFTRQGSSLYASGHPGPATPSDFGTPNLGLIRSTDTAETWQNISLTGKTDFHGLAVSDADPDRIYGLDYGILRRSDDGGATWTEAATLTARDILAAPGNPDIIYATTEDGLAVSTDGGMSFVTDSSAPSLFLLTTFEDRLAGIDTDQRIAYQTPAGEWRTGGATEQPQALATAPGGRIVVADSRGIVVTDDYGKTWTVLRPSQPHN